jgi:hypothetical protein
VQTTVLPSPIPFLVIENAERHPSGRLAFGIAASTAAALTSAAPTVVRADRMMFIATYALLVGLVGVALVYLGARP